MKTMFRIIGLAIILLGVRQTAGGLSTCIGTCTVTCNSGTIYFYSTRSFACCSKESVCPDGGQAEWYPGGGLQCNGESALICP